MTCNSLPSDSGLEREPTVWPQEHQEGRIKPLYALANTCAVFSVTETRPIHPYIYRTTTNEVAAVKFL